MMLPRATMEKNRLYWASRRGMLELDLVLNPFLDNFFDDLEEIDKTRFVALLEEQDQDLFRWFMGTADPEDKELLKIVEVIRRTVGPNQSLSG